MNIRLFYFNFPFWRVEASRIALHLGGIPFEDVRVSRDEFMTMKQSGELPYGQLPVMDVDGVRIAQSLAIARFCGRVSGLYPEDPLTAARVDEILNTADQITLTLYPSMGEKNAEKKMALRVELGASTLPKLLSCLEKRMESDDTFVGDQMTIADLVIWRLLGWLTGGILDGIPTDLLDACPKLGAMYQRIESRQDVQAWMSRHYGR